MRTTLVCAAVVLLLPWSTDAQDIDFTDYHTPAQVEAEMANLETRFPSLARRVEIGRSLEDNPIWAVKISDNPDLDESDEGDVIFVALHHAREWISAEMALYLAEHLLENYSLDPELQADIDNLEIWVVPVLNPDGYVYSDTSYRYWRKNRRDNGDGSFGVDINRNYGYEWGHDSGSSSVPSYPTYRGPAPFSEPETRVMRDLVQSVDNLKAFVTYHSFSELVLRPWSYTNADAPGELILRNHVERAVDLIEAVHGHTYGTELYLSSGEATDYLWGETRTAAFTTELRPDYDPMESSLEDFAPPPGEIIPNNEENLPMALALIHDAGGREVWVRDHPDDTGAEPSAVWTGSGWSRPFWLSPDIWTDVEVLPEGATVDLNVRVQNAAGSPRHDVEVFVYWSDPRVSLEFPSPSATLIGADTINVPPGGRVVTFPWTVPTGTNIWGERHWCVGVVVKHARDLPLTTEARRSSNVAIRNFNTTEMTASGMLLAAATNYLDVAAELRVHVDTTSLPRGWRVFVPPQPKLQARDRPSALVRKGRLLDAQGPLLEPGETVLIPIRVDLPDDPPGDTVADVHVHGTLLPLVPGKRVPVGNGYTYRVRARADPGQ